MPDTAEKMQKHLGLEADKTFFSIDLLKTWNVIKPGTRLPKSITLFPRIDVKKKKERALKETKPTLPEIKPEISIDKLAAIDLRVGTILHAEAIPRAKKVLKLEVDIGENRTIVAGIAASYSPDELLGKQVIVVANLKPAKLMGILSNGMLLAAVDGKNCTVATLDGKVPPGTPVK